jgi:hypothetical protein
MTTRSLGIWIPEDILWFQITMTAKQISGRTIGICTTSVGGMVSICLSPAGKFESVKDRRPGECRITMDAVESICKPSTLLYYPCTCLVMFWGRLLTSLPIIEKIGIGPWENKMVCCALFIGG